MNNVTILCFCIVFFAGDALGQDDEKNKTEKADPGARIASYGKVGRVLVDGQTVFISKGLTDIIMEEGEADLENDDKIKCEKRRRTGSHVIMRICRTVAELEEMQEFNEEYYQRFVRQRKTLCASGGSTRAERAFPGDNSSFCGR